MTVSTRSDGCQRSFWGDDDQLLQVFWNLLDNAIEYSGDEKPRVPVDAERWEARSASERSDNAAETAGDRWLVAVADGGIGIDPTPDPVAP